MDELLPCPFCGAGETIMSEKHMPPRMSGPGQLISVEIRHWCQKYGYGLSRLNVCIAAQTHEAVVLMWNTRPGCQDQSQNG